MMPSDSHGRAGAGSAPIEATLFSRAGCHLCEAAEAELRRLQPGLPHRVQVVDVDADPQLAARYGERVPVLLLGGLEIDPPLTRRVLECAFRQAQRRR